MCESGKMKHASLIQKFKTGHLTGYGMFSLIYICTYFFFRNAVLTFLCSVIIIAVF